MMTKNTIHPSPILVGTPKEEIRFKIERELDQIIENYKYYGSAIVVHLSPYFYNQCQEVGIGKQYRNLILTSSKVEFNKARKELSKTHFEIPKT